MAQILTRRVILGAVGASAIYHLLSSDEVFGEDFTIPIVDARERDIKAIRIFAANNSKGNRIVLIAHNVNRKLYNEVVRAAEESKKEGLPIEGIVIGPIGGGVPQVELYVNSTSVSRNNSLRNYAAIYEAIRFAHKEYLNSESDRQRILRMR